MTVAGNRRCGIESATRRHVLVGVGAAGALALAGCLDGGAEDPDDAGAGTGDDGAGTTETSMGAETDPTGTETDVTGADADETLERFQQVVRAEDAFAMSGTFTAENATVDMEGRFDGTNMYLRIEQDGQVFESYRVDGDHYLVSGGRCFTDPQQSVEPSGVDPENVPERTGELPDVRPVGRTTIDGEAMLVYEFDASEAAAGTEQDVTYYVSADTGYLRRVEGEFGVLDYHSWGDVAAISPPDMDCESY